MFSLKIPAILALCIFLAGTAATGRAHARRGTPVIIGQVTAIALYWPDFIAQQKGFYAAEGLDAESFFAGSTAAATQNLISGTIDIASAAT
jgi:ABC-type nitrate/sulfonate/bicarbonate transport system substrate-binding protein